MSIHDFIISIKFIDSNSVGYKFVLWRNIDMDIN